jgi:hypothetical protein
MEYHLEVLVDSYAAPNNSFDPTGLSQPLIVNLDAARQVFPAGQFER